MSLNNANLTRWLLPILLVAFALSACSSGGADALDVGDTAPDFSLQNALGGTVSLQDYVGEQPVLLYFHMAVG
jgi:hypothetical protein